MTFSASKTATERLFYLSEDEAETNRWLENLPLHCEIPALNGRELSLCYRDGELFLSAKKVSKTGLLQIKDDAIVSCSQTMESLLALATRLADADLPLLLEGPSGTGKQLLARWIHSQSPHRNSPFIPLSCPSRGAALLAEQVGQSGGGTLYCCDTIDPELLHQMLQQAGERQDCGYRLIFGQQQPHPLSASTSRWLQALGLVRLSVPPLSERRDDIAAIASYTLFRFCRDHQLATKQLSDEVLRIFNLYPWPGNVRELINSVRQSAHQAWHQQTLFARDLPRHIRLRTLGSQARGKKGI